MTQQEQARAFHALHQDGLLILPNAWDAGSACIIEAAGAKAIATSSAALAWAHGYPDGQAMPLATLIAAVREIVRAVHVPVSTDFEAGFADDPNTVGDFVARLIEVGAVGINIEDGHGSPDVLCAKIHRVRHDAQRKGVDLWINARIDVYLHKLAQGESAYEETVRRAKLYGDAGAHSIFVPGAAEESLIARLVADIALPLNILAWPGLPDAARLQALGVRRLSAGAGLARASLGFARSLAEAFLRDGRSEPFGEGPYANANINALMPRD
ncbi:MAG TPA: isocitrate lyase/phosphoenolpyruvate mutase family protein [Rhizomicrobium sp.]|jgi:2-methylisocitrate lyase-like PEP mutase family enzyme|nr:isocitrate lyase/phosphoenolpyruvate mutase family protein [Rhizomicrobium sp.]